MKILRILALAAAAIGFASCKSSDSGSTYTPPQGGSGGTYIDSGK